MTEIVRAEVDAPREFVLVTTGERLPATRDNAAAAIAAAREAKDRLQSVIRDAEDWLAEESRLHGTKTFETDYGKVVLSGGPTVEYDAHALAEGLRAAGCPEERVAEAVVETVSYKVDKRVLRQLTAANPAYAAAAEQAAVEVDAPVRATLKSPTRRRTP